MRTDENSKSDETLKRTRREALKAILAGSLGGAAAVSMEEKILAQELAERPALSREVKNQTRVFGDDGFVYDEQEAATKHEVDGASGATRTSFTLPQRAKLIEKLPCSTIKGIKLSRVMLGGNLLTGFVHSRDLLYVSQLAMRYNTKNKVYETMLLAEECGMNAFIAYPGVVDMLKDYYKWTDGKIKYIADCRSPYQVQKSIDFGAVATYVNGDWTDSMVAQEKYDYLQECIDQAHANDKPCGLGAHRIETLKKATEKGIQPDFFMKTFHSKNYWSAQAATEHDNIYCRDDAETKEFMAGRPEPWIAFKVCAAGAIMPADGLRYAFESGADFVALGMYDFQLVDNVNTAVEILKSDLKRTRPWTNETLPPDDGEDEDEA